MIDNDQCAPATLNEPGIYALPDEPRHVALFCRVQLLDYADPADVAAAYVLQDGFVIEAGSAEPFPAPEWVDAGAALRIQGGVP